MDGDLRPLPAGVGARIVAVVRAMRLDAVMERLVAVAPRDVAIEEVRGYGRQKEHLTFYERVGDWQGNFLPKVRLEFTVAGTALEATVAALREGAFTGRIGDGKIFVHAVHLAEDPAP